jgi:gluconokinase
MKTALVIMGVAGCGKSSLGAALAQSTGLALVEGDDFHSAESLKKMSMGMPLTDEDRAGWLETLATQLRSHPEGVVLTCSALKARYRNRLRAARPDLHFVFLDIDPALAQARVAARGQSHFFSTSLMQSQFAALESPVGEAGVLRLDASQSLEQLLSSAHAWANSKETL